MSVSSPRRSKKRSRAHTLWVERHYMPDLARQAQALLRLLEGYTEEPLAGQNNGDIGRQDKESTKLGGNQDATT
jgi:hypothetical protein